MVENEDGKIADHHHTLVQNISKKLKKVEELRSCMDGEDGKASEGGHDGERVWY